MSFKHSRLFLWIGVLGAQGFGGTGCNNPDVQWKLPPAPLAEPSVSPSEASPPQNHTKPETSKPSEEISEPLPPPEERVLPAFVLKATTFSDDAKRHLSDWITLETQLATTPDNPYHYYLLVFPRLAHLIEDNNAQDPEKEVKTIHWVDNFDTALPHRKEEDILSNWNTVNSGNGMFVLPLQPDSAAPSSSGTSPFIRFKTSEKLLNSVLGQALQKPGEENTSLQRQKQCITEKTLREMIEGFQNKWAQFNDDPSDKEASAIVLQKEAFEGSFKTCEGIAQQIRKDFEALAKKAKDQKNITTGDLSNYIFYTQVIAIPQDAPPPVVAPPPGDKTPPATVMEEATLPPLLSNFFPVMRVPKAAPEAISFEYYYNEPIYHLERIKQEINQGTNYGSVSILFASPSVRFKLTPNNNPYWNHIKTKKIKTKDTQWEEWTQTRTLDTEGSSYSITKDLPQEKIELNQGNNWKTTDFNYEINFTKGSPDATPPTPSTLATQITLRKLPGEFRILKKEAGLLQDTLEAAEEITFNMPPIELTGSGEVDRRRCSLTIKTNQQDFKYQFRYTVEHHFQTLKRHEKYNPSTGTWTKHPSTNISTTTEILFHSINSLKKGTPLSISQTLAQVPQYELIPVLNHSLPKQHIVFVGSPGAPTQKVIMDLIEPLFRGIQEKGITKHNAKQGDPPKHPFKILDFKERFEQNWKAICNTTSYKCEVRLPGMQFWTFDPKNQLKGFVQEYSLNSTKISNPFVTLGSFDADLNIPSELNQKYKKEPDDANSPELFPKWLQTLDPTEENEPVDFFVLLSKATEAWRGVADQHQSDPPPIFVFVSDTTKLVSNETDFVTDSKINEITLIKEETKAPLFWLTSHKEQKIFIPAGKKPNGYNEPGGTTYTLDEQKTKLFTLIAEQFWKDSGIFDPTSPPAP